MIRLLASVTDGDEAEQAIQGGADLIDCKDPTRGALGALPLKRIREIVRVVAGRRPVSATIGDLPPEAGLTEECIRATADTGVTYVKVGLFSDAYRDTCLPVIQTLAPRCAIVVVLFADRAPRLSDLRPFAAAGCAGLMLDTAHKSGGRLIEHLDFPTLQAFVTQTRSFGLLCGLAGSLCLEDVSPLLTLEPDYLGFRGALCQSGQRQAGLDSARVGAVWQAMRRPAG